MRPLVTRAAHPLADEQIEFERRLATSEGRLDQVAVIAGDLNRRVVSLEQKMGPGKPITDQQASQIGPTSTPPVAPPCHRQILTIVTCSPPAAPYNSKVDCVSTVSCSCFVSKLRRKK